MCDMRELRLYPLVRAAGIELDEIPASRSQWSGTAQGQAMSGVMYCVVVGTVVVSFHTQDTEEGQPNDRNAAIAAFEGVRFKESR